MFLVIKLPMSFHKKINDISLKLLKINTNFFINTYYYYKRFTEVYGPQHPEVTTEPLERDTDTPASPIPSPPQANAVPSAKPLIEGIIDESAPVSPEGSTVDDTSTASSALPASCRKSLKFPV